MWNWIKQHFATLRTKEGIIVDKGFFAPSQKVTAMLILPVLIFLNNKYGPWFSHDDLVMIAAAIAAFIAAKGWEDAKKRAEAIRGLVLDAANRLPK